MTRFTGGDALRIEWIHPGGTALLGGAYRKLTIRHAADAAETTGGTAPDRAYAPGRAAFTIRLEGFHNGTSSPLGTADLNALAPRTAGTVRVWPLGTASPGGIGRWQGAAVVSLREITLEYDELAAVVVEWRGDGPLTQV
jgi:hypothetical protein